VSEHKQERPYPASMAFILNNPIRRWLSPPHELLDKLDIKSTDDVLDFGCGPGYYTLELAKTAKSVLAVDISNEMLQKVKERAFKARILNIKYLQSDGKNYRF
jgi:ubiquinone/menaquinone biosynthesis C-methylase UbiE